MSKVTRFENGISPGQLSADPSSAKSGDMYYNTTLNKTRIFNGIAWSNVGSGSGGGKNYLTDINANPGNGDFELSTTNGWSLGTTGTLTNGIPTGSPTFGSGANGNLSIATVSSGQLGGLYSLSYISAAATTVGNMLASDTFTIDLEDQAKVLTWKFYYKAQTNPTNANWSGTSSNSFGVAIWDVTNSAWLTSTANFAMTQSSGVGLATGTCQTNATTTQLRFVMYNVNATTGAVTVYFDDFSIGPQTAPIGAVMADLGTETWTDNQTNATTSVILTRVGPTLFVDGITTFTGAFTGGSFSVTVPAAYTAATSPGVQHDPVGFAYSSIGSHWLTTIAFQGGPNNLLFYVNTDDSGDASAYVALANPTPTVPQTWANGSFIRWRAEWRVSGWSSNVQMSNDTDTRVVAFATAGTTVPVSGGAAAAVSWGTVLTNTHGTFNGTTTYTIPVSGIYHLNMTGFANPSGASGGTIFTNFRKNNIDQGPSGTNGLQNAGQNYQVACSNYLTCNAGDTITLVASHNTGTTVTFAGVWSATRMSGPSVIAATESVNMSAINNSGQSIPNTGANTVITGWTTIFDSHGAFNASTGVYTVPVSGKYRISGSFNYQSNTYAAGNTIYAAILKNGSVMSFGPIESVDQSTGQQKGESHTDIGSFLAGDTISTTAANTRTAGATSLQGNQVWMAVERIGN